MNKIVTVELPENVVAEIERVQAATGEGLADFVTTAARERAAALTGNRFFARRAKAFDRDAFLEVLNRDGGEPPQLGDEVPEGYVPTRERAFAEEADSVLATVKDKQAALSRGP
jgi:hypothetical protein